jgi:hypothetical protein
MVNPSDDDDMSTDEVFIDKNPHRLRPNQMRVQWYPTASNSKVDESKVCSVIKFTCYSSSLGALA